MVRDSALGLSEIRGFSRAASRRLLPFHQACRRYLWVSIRVRTRRRLTSSAPVPRAAMLMVPSDMSRVLPTYAMGAYLWRATTTPTIKLARRLRRATTLDSNDRCLGCKHFARSRESAVFAALQWNIRLNVKVGCAVRPRCAFCGLRAVRLLSGAEFA